MSWPITAVVVYASMYLVLALCVMVRGLLNKENPHGPVVYLLLLLYPVILPFQLIDLRDRLSSEKKRKHAETERRKREEAERKGLEELISRSLRSAEESGELVAEEKAICGSALNGFKPNRYQRFYLADLSARLESFWTAAENPALFVKEHFASLIAPSAEALAQRDQASAQFAFALNQSPPGSGCSLSAASS